MKAVILAAGKSSRFYPFNTEEHKSFVKVMGKPLIEHTLIALKKSGIDEIVLVVRPQSRIQEYLGNGETLGLHITYVIQEEALGMGHGLLQAKDILTDSFFLLSGYHMEFGEFRNEMEQMQDDNETSVVLVKQSDDMSQFGVVELDGDKVINITEKPEVASSSYRLVAMYLLTPSFLSLLENTPLAEYHFEEALAKSAKEGHVKAVVTDKATISLKYPWHLFGIKEYLLSRIETSSLSERAHIAKDVVITGNVIVEDGAQIMEGVVIKGPAYVGKNVIVGNRSILRNGVSIEEGAVIGAGMELKNTLVMEGTTTHSGFIGDSLIGKKTKIAAYVCTANVRLDRQLVSSVVKGEKVNTGIKHLGVIIGNNANIGIRVSTMPGVIIGNNTIIGPSTNVMKNVADNTRYFTRFQEVVEEEIHDEK